MATSSTIEHSRNFQCFLFFHDRLNGNTVPASTNEYDSEFRYRLRGLAICSAFSVTAWIVILGMIFRP